MAMLYYRVSCVQVGVNASSQAILEHLIRADTASAFNISVGDVNVTGISQVLLSCCPLQLQSSTAWLPGLMGYSCNDRASCQRRKSSAGMHRGRCRGGCCT